MELSQVIKIAQAHLNGENVSLDKVLKAFETFVEDSKPLSKRTYCIAEKSLAYVWSEAEHRSLLISDDEAINFLKEFYIYSDGVITTVEQEFDLNFEGKFSDAPKGSIFANAIANNNFEKVKAMIEYGTINLDDPVRYEENDVLPIELAVRRNHKEIVGILLVNGAAISKNFIEDTTDPDIKMLLEKAQSD